MPLSTSKMIYYVHDPTPILRRRASWSSPWAARTDRNRTKGTGTEALQMANQLLGPGVKLAMAHTLVNNTCSINVSHHVLTSLVC